MMANTRQSAPVAPPNTTEFVTNSLSTRLPEFVYDPDNGCTFELEVDEISKPLLTINTHRGLYQFNRLPFGVQAAPGIFQQCIDTLIAGLEGTAAYLDDILVTGRPISEHNTRLDAVFKRIQDYLINRYRVIYKRLCIVSPKLQGKGHSHASKKARFEAKGKKRNINDQVREVRRGRRVKVNNEENFRVLDDYAEYSFWEKVLKNRSSDWSTAKQVLEHLAQLWEIHKDTTNSIPVKSSQREQEGGQTNTKNTIRARQLLV
ncbi:unnamed protein product [Nippostrongylus brasiliensis]|uniref:Reverse transcriptase domain-containing protein n=1 Tax=Nippostrongylus brasiliensis TaxID=27835 RepID=A0A0N4YF61_NIPBR|nr:unnamed protein product [Nippostrongylus brasiliensis]